MFKHLFLSLMLLFALQTTALAEERTFTVAHDATWAPMEFAVDNKVVGYSVDYIDAVAKEMGFKLEHKVVAWDGIFAGLQAGRYDLVASSVTITPERQVKYDFSTPYCEVRQAVVVPMGSSVKAVSDLSGKTLGAQVSTTGHFALKKMTNVKDKPYDEISLAMEDLKNGRSDGVVCDSPVAAYYATKRKNFADQFKIAFQMTEVEYYGFVVKKGNKELLELLNKGVKIIKDKGIEVELQKKWFGVQG